MKEEIVYLKEYEGKITNTFTEVEEVRIDPVITNQFIQFFRDLLNKKKGKKAFFVIVLS